MADDIANTLDGSFILFFMQTVPDECVILHFAHAFSSWFSFSVAMMSQLVIHTDSFYIN